MRCHVNACLNHPFPPPPPAPQPKLFKSYVQDPQLFWHTPVMSAVSREVARQALLDAGRADDARGLAWAPSLARFPHPEMTTLSVTGRVIAPCIFAACMFGAVTQARRARVARVWGRARARCLLHAPLRPEHARRPADRPPPSSPAARPAPSRHHAQMAQIVAEKDAGLRQAMRTMGLMESSYWGSWVVFDLAFGALLTLAIIFSGACARARALHAARSARALRAAASCRV